MQRIPEVPIGSQETIAKAKECLALVAQIAQRGAASDNPEHIGYALQELSQVLLERTGREDRLFELVAADQIVALARLHEELDWVDGFAADMNTPRDLPRLSA